MESFEDSRASNHGFRVPAQCINGAEFKGADSEFDSPVPQVVLRVFKHKLIP